MIEIQNLYKSFGKNVVLQGIDLKIQKPGIYAILGPNGSGKTTLIKSLLGMVIPEKGRIAINGQDISHQWAYRKDIDYLPQIARFPENLTVLELISMVRDIRGNKAHDMKLIRLFELEPFLSKRLSTLSGGTRQKVNLVIAFMFDSPLMILDEPTAGLDPVAMLRLKGLIQEEKRNGKTILITSHIMRFVEEMADEIIFLLEGKIHFKGTLHALLERSGERDMEHAIAALLQKGKSWDVTNNYENHAKNSQIQLL